VCPATSRHEHWRTETESLALLAPNTDRREPGYTVSDTQLPVAVTPEGVQPPLPRASQCVGVACRDQHYRHAAEALHECRPGCIVGVVVA
jgi:hypothetical protein